jgi:hypothetical protein
MVPSPYPRALDRQGLSVTRNYRGSARAPSALMTRLHGLQRADHEQAPEGWSARPRPGSRSSLPASISRRSYTREFGSVREASLTAARVRGLGQLAPKLWPVLLVDVNGHGKGRRSTLRRRALRRRRRLACPGRTHDRRAAARRGPRCVAPSSRSCVPSAGLTCRPAADVVWVGPRAVARERRSGKGPAQRSIWGS